MAIKERVETILGGFLERNKDYAVHVYIRNGVTGNCVADMVIPMDRNVELKREKFLLTGNVGDISYCNSLSLPYDEILGCYEENAVEDRLKIAEMVAVILKNGMQIEVECVGDRI